MFFFDVSPRSSVFFSKARDEEFRTDLPCGAGEIHHDSSNWHPSGFGMCCFSTCSNKVLASVCKHRIILSLVICSSKAINFTKWESIHKIKKHITPPCLLEVQGDQYTELSNVWKQHVLWIAPSKHQLLLGKLQPLKLQKSHDPNGSPKWLAYTKNKHETHKKLKLAELLHWYPSASVGFGWVGWDWFLLSTKFVVSLALVPIPHMAWTSSADRRKLARHPGAPWLGRKGVDAMPTWWFWTTSVETSTFGKNFPQIFEVTITKSLKTPPRMSEVWCNIKNPNPSCHSSTVLKVLRIDLCQNHVQFSHVIIHPNRVPSRQS